LRKTPHAGIERKIKKTEARRDAHAEALITNDAAEKRAARFRHAFAQRKPRAHSARMGGADPIAIEDNAADGSCSMRAAPRPPSRSRPRLERVSMRVLAGRRRFTRRFHRARPDFRAFGGGVSRSAKKAQVYSHIKREQRK